MLRRFWGKNILGDEKMPRCASVSFFNEKKNYAKIFSSADKKKKQKNISTRMGFEPTRAEHIGLAVQRLNHSATSSDTNVVGVISDKHTLRSAALTYWHLWELQVFSHDISFPTDEKKSFNRAKEGLNNELGLLFVHRMHLNLIQRMIVVCRSFSAISIRIRCRFVPFPHFLYLWTPTNVYFTYFFYFLSICAFHISPPMTAPFVRPRAVRRELHEPVPQGREARSPVILGCGGRWEEDLKEGGRGRVGRGQVRERGKFPPPKKNRSLNLHASWYFYGIPWK